LNSTNRLVDSIGHTFILAYREPTDQLVSVLSAMGCECEVLRQTHQPGYEAYSRSFLCLLNHRQAWQRALTCAQPTLIVEADFVPVQNFAQLPCPFDPADADWGIGWLYTCASQIYSLTTAGYAQGYSTAMVAYVINARSAQCLIDLADAIATDPGPNAYSPWDSGLEYYLRDRGFKNYVPWRNYGEHGGIPNPEHQQNNLSRTHRADVLYGALAFAPAYTCTPAQDSLPEAQVSRLDWLKERSYARGKGVARLVLNKYLRLPVLRGSSHPLRLLGFALSRQFTPRL
jgi:hypothetical protein